MLFYLIAGHMLMDFALQGDAIATCKCRSANHPLQKSVPWYYWMLAHCFLHGAMVGVILQWFGVDVSIAIAFAILETIIHTLIDICKCAKYFGIHTDQALHIGCKIVWWGILFSGVLPEKLPAYLPLGF